ncbi:MAG: hypothetical protein ACW97Z_11270 [Candidatus Hodarchaeales archaeon]|jgi:hypothetical protein
MKIIPESVIQWLLEEENPSIRYRTMVELQDIPTTSEEVKKAQEALQKYPVVQNILKKMQPEGYWQVKKREGRIIGAGVEYADWSTTHYVLSYLAELGVTRDNPQVEKATNRYLSLQQPDGDFWNHFSCLYGLNIRTFVKLGFEEDPRVSKTIDLLKTMIREDQGYLCDLHEGKRKTRLVKSCYRGTVKVLFALSELPNLWTETHTKRLVNYFLDRNVLYKTKHPTEFVTRETGRTIFPFSYRAGLLEILYALAKMGYGDNSRVQNAWSILQDHRTAIGRYILDWTPGKTTNRYFYPGQKQTESKWVTFYAYLCLKYKKRVV